MPKKFHFAGLWDGTTKSLHSRSNETNETEETDQKKEKEMISPEEKKQKRLELLQSINTSMFISSFTLLLYNVVKDVENWYVLVLGMSSTVILSQAIVSFVWPQWENICYPLSWAAISIAAIQTTFFLQEFYFCR